MTLRALYIDFNAYFASVEQQLQPAWRGRPLAVVPMLTDTTCCIAASYEARAFGIKTGTLVREARQKGIRTLELNLEPSHGTSWFAESRHGPATQVVPAWVDEILGG